MNRIEIVEFLIDEIKQEKEKHKIFCEIYEHNYCVSSEKIPHKSRVKSNILKIRQLLNDERISLERERW